MPVWFNRDRYLKTLTDSQQNRLWILVKITILDFGGVLVGSLIAVTSSGLVEFYITGFWIVE